VPAIRETAKAMARGLATLAVAPLLIWSRASARMIGPDRAVQGATQALALVPGLSGQYLRRAFLCRALASCHSSVTVEFGTIFSKAGASIGEDAYIGPMSHIGLAQIEPGAMLGAGVHVLSGPRTHGIGEPDALIRDQPGEAMLVQIGRGAWVGSAAVIMADVGAGAVIGAGAVVTRPIPPLAVAAGVPARVLRRRGPGESSSESRTNNDIPPCSGPQSPEAIAPE
jgi:acetyltransferase-like isoleucine patch superfamily enzyme